jgi:nitrate reductase alpha subunit
VSWIKDIVDPQARSWEEFYRNRWQHDKVVRSTHGVNCTGGCSWNIHVKEGIVTWEMQALDYPMPSTRACRPMSRAAASAGSPSPGTCTAPSA